MGVLVTLVLIGFLVARYRPGRVPEESRAATAVSLPDAPGAAEQAILDQAAREGPRDPAPATALGDLHLREGRPFLALWEYSRALHVSEVHPPAMLGLARALDAALLHEAAIARLQQLERLRPEVAEAVPLLAELYLRTGRPEEARAALELNREALGASLLHGRVLKALGDVAGARTVFRRAAESGGPDAAEAWRRIGMLELAAGRREPALLALAKAVELEPTDPRAAVERARAVAAGGRAADRQEALSLLRRVVESRPNGSAFLEAGRLLALEGRLPQAAATLGRATEADRGLWEAYAALAEVLQKMGRKAEAHYQRGLAFSVRDLRVRALREYLAMAAADPSRPDGLLLASQSHFKMQQNARGVALARRAHARFPGRPEVREQLAALLILANDRKGAAALCEAWLREEPEASVPHRMLGRIAANDLRFEEAIRHYEQAIAREPENADYRLAFGESLLAAPGADRLNQAVATLSRAAALAPSDARARYHLGLALSRSGRDAEAGRQLLRTLDLDPYQGPAYSALIPVARRLGEAGPVGLFAPLSRAVEDRLREELALWRQTWDHPEAPDGYLALGRFLIRTAEAKKAEAQLEEALRLRPGWPPARAELTRVRRLLSAL
jgi:tetratricopeptide (TPR) repeat protein